MEYKIKANNQKEAVEVYKAIRQIQQGKHNITVNADNVKDAVRIYKEAKRVSDSKKVKDAYVEIEGDWDYDAAKAAEKLGLKFKYTGKRYNGYPEARIEGDKQKILTFMRKWYDPDWQLSDIDDSKKVKDSIQTKDEDGKLMRAIIDICKKYNYYTSGTLDDYNKLLNRADKMRLDDIAINISAHSDETDYKKVYQILKKELGYRGIVKDRKDNFLSADAKKLKHDLGLYQNNAKKRPDGSEYAKNTGRKQNVNPWNRRVTESMNDALELIVNGEKLDVALEGLNKCITDYKELLNDSRVSKENKDKLKIVIARAEQIENRIKNK